MAYLDNFAHGKTFSHTERLKALREFVVGAPWKQVRHYIEEASPETRGEMLIAVASAAAPKEVGSLLQCDIPEIAQRNALSIALAQIDTTHGQKHWQAVHAVSKLVYAVEPQKFPEFSAGPVAKLLNRYGKGKAAMIVLDIGHGAKDLVETHFTRDGFLALTATALGIAATYGAPHQPAIAQVVEGMAAATNVLSIVGLHIRDALAEGRARRLIPIAKNLISYS